MVLTKEATQTIIPMSRLMDVGHVLKWDNGGCSISHPRHGLLPVQMAQGCPMVNATWGKRLMDELEGDGRRKAYVRMIMACGMMAESSYEKDLAKLRADFPEVPEAILERVPGLEDWSAECIPVNRRQRKRIEMAKNIIVHAFAGEDQARWKAMETQDTVVLCLDVKSGMNLHNPHVCGWLDSILATGKVRMWVAGPPCRTVSVSRHRDDDGPKPLRGRYGATRFGLPGLAEWQQEVTDGDTVLWLKNLVWMQKAQKHFDPVKLMLEQPQDPAEWKENGKDNPCFLVWPETKAVVKALGLMSIRLQQGALGHPTCKPTTLVSNMEEIFKLEGCRSTETQEWPTSAKERVMFSKRLAAWAPGLVDAIGREVDRISAACRLKALTAKQKQELEGYERHCAANHLPYRRDCATCVEAAGRDRARRRIQHPEAFCWSVDLAGPFRAGKDMEVNQARYFMVHTVTIPLKDGAILVDGLHQQAPARPAEEVDLESRDEPDGGDPMQEVEEQECGEELPAEDQAAVEKAQERWNKYVQEKESVETTSLTWAVPLASPKTDDIIAAAAQGYSRLRALGIPVIRVHSDRAREFTSKSFRRWASQRSLYTTYTAGDEPCGNSRAEREVGRLKARTRVLIQATASPLASCVTSRGGGTVSSTTSPARGSSTKPDRLRSFGGGKAENLVSSRSGLEIPYEQSTMLWASGRHEPHQWRLCSAH